MPGKPMTRDNLRSMQLDSVCQCDFEAQFGFTPTSLNVVAPTYLAAKTPRGRYQNFRYHAGR
jgi:NADH dehydrogenase